MRISVEKIRIRSTHRPVNPERVKLIAESIKQNGLRYPITLQKIRKDNEYIYYLVAGRHRLAATKKNGTALIEYVLEEGSDFDAKRWEIAENLHRAELSTAERAKATKDYVALLEAEESEAVSASSCPKSLPSKTRPKTAVLNGPKSGRPPGPMTKAAKELGLPISTVKAQLKIASISDEAQAAAKESGVTGFNDLLVIARQPKAKQVEAVAKVAKANTAHAANKTLEFAPNELAQQWTRASKKARLDFCRQYREQLEATFALLEFG